MKNKYKDIVENHYTQNYEEETRFQDFCSSVEYWTTMKYIKKYAKKCCKILEVGAGTGAYSIELAKLGFDVTAIELVQRNVEIMQEKSEGLSNLKCMQGDALDLSNFADNQFDIVLNLGPLYHLYSTKDRKFAINESIRVCKTGGLCMFAYLPHGAVILHSGVRKGHIKEMQYAIKKDGSLRDIPKELFSSMYIEDIEKIFQKMPTTFVKNIATSGVLPLFRDYIEPLDDEAKQYILNWHFATCERRDQQGLSTHCLYICKKN